eukprot:s3462_g1.t6
MSAFVSGASRGIGLALVEGLLRGTSLNVVASGRKAMASPGLQALKAEHSSRLLPLDMDLTNEESIKAAAAASDEFTGGGLGLLIHSAGIMHPNGRGENSVTTLDQASFTAVLATNVMGPALLTKALYPKLRAAGKEEPSKVVALGAGVGSVGTNQAGGWYSYRISKTGFRLFVFGLFVAKAFMKNLAIEGCRHNVVALTLYPQMVDTDLAKPYLKGNPYSELRTPKETADRMLELLAVTGRRRFVGSRLTLSGLQIPAASSTSGPARISPGEESTLCAGGDRTLISAVIHLKAA